ncbi:MAG: CPBP family intramembrane metalloprotease, partial [Lachnospiraceae bacterium]|nr:CPBP family intramembrane metalloprotease [Lachnospiraceae bacterium]
AMGEELLFRGFLMGTLRPKAKPVVVIATVAVLFAAYHMSILRFFTVGIIGLSFTIAAYRSESIFVSMLMHFCNNLTACLVQWYPDSILRLLNADPDIANSPLTGVALVAGAAVLIAAGCLLLSRKKVLA